MLSSRSLLFFPTALLAAVLAACSSYMNYEEGASVAVETRVVEEAPPPYRIQPGDGLTILFAHHATRKSDVVVRMDGKVSMPFAEEVHVAGLTVAEVDAALTRRVGAHLRDPELTVVVATTARSLVFVGGEVARAGQVPLVPGMTAFQALTAVGGMAPSGARDSVMLVRADGPGKRIVRRLSLDETNMFTHDYVLAPFDILFVPTTSVADVGLFVSSHVNAIIPRAASFSGFYNISNVFN